MVRGNLAMEKLVQTRVNSLPEIFYCYIVLLLVSESHKNLLIQCQHFSALSQLHLVYYVIMENSHYAR